MTRSDGPAAPIRPEEPLTAGPPITRAEAAVVLLHGRNASAAGALSLASPLDPGGVAFLAPQAPGGSWYPAAFLAPFEDNEPYLSAALSQVESVVRAVEAAALAPERIVLAGFSQGACLALEAAARRPRRYGAVIGWTGGRIGPPATRFEEHGSLDGTPVLLTAGDPDPHVPWRRVEETASSFERMGAKVDLRRYPGRPHTITGDELEAAAALVARVAADAARDQGPSSSGTSTPTGGRQRSSLQGW